MEKEMEALIKVSALTSALMAYARFATARIPPGPCRLLALLPVTAVLIRLPFSFSSLHLRGISAFFLAWLSVFKLLLLSFDAGPLSPTLPFLTFLPVATLPVKIRPFSDAQSNPSYLILSYAAKALLFSILLSLYPHRDKFPFHVLLALYCCHIYLSLDLILAAAAFFSGSVFGLDLEPQFNAPYRSTSLQDFWGRRWNLMVTAILRPSVYGPVRERWGAAAGVMATFAVSGLMHELMFYYITSAPPTGEVSCFFVLHGVCTAAEVWVKGKGNGSGDGCGGGRSRQLNTIAAGVTTLGFVAVTGFWLFFPPLLRNGADKRALKECAAVIGLLESGSRAARGWFGL